MEKALYRNLLNQGVDWLCNNCYQSAFPLASLENNEILNFFDSRTCNSTPLAKKTKCDSCPRQIPQKGEYALCTTCNKYNHLKCAGLTSHDFPLPVDYQCLKCSTQSLPFSKVTNDDLLLTIEGFDKQSADFLRNVPSFSIQSLIDNLPGQKFDTDEFISDNTESKYHTPAQFIAEKLPKKSFTMFHMNIASLQAHIDELRTLLTLLDHPFDAVCITETRLHDPKPLVNINIPGYDFLHTPTNTGCGGAGMYVKSIYHPIPIDKLSVSHEDICESIFTEIKSNTNKNLLIGCIYRHHTTIPTFISTYFEKTLNHIIKSKKTVHF